MKTFLRLYMLLASTVFAGPVLGQERKPEMIALEKNLRDEMEEKAWEGVKNSDPKARKALLTENSLKVTESGRRNLQEALKFFAQPSPFKTYKLSEIKVISLGANAAVYSYRAFMDSANSADVCAVYVNRGQR